jgi:hypothetical protein
VGLRKFNIDIAAKRRKKHKNKISGLVISMCYHERKIQFFTNPSILVRYPYLSNKDIGKTYFAGAIQAASKKYVPFSNPGRDQCEILNTCRLIYSEILMVQSKDFLNSLGFCKSDKGSIGKIHGEVAVFFH